MRARTWAARGAVWLSAAAVACGDSATPSGGKDSAASTPDAVSPDAGDALESGDSNAGTPDAGVTPLSPFTPPCDPAGDGACQNDSDCDSNLSGRVAEGSQTCGGCLLMLDPVPCFEECLVTAAGLSSSCSTCFAELAGCGWEFCAAPCVADIAGDACRSCRDENGCSESFVSCSGIAL